MKYIKYSHIAWMIVAELLVTAKLSAAATPATTNALHVYPRYDGIERSMVCQTSTETVEGRTDGSRLFMDGQILQPEVQIGPWIIEIGKNPLANVFFVSFVNYASNEEIKIVIDFELGLVEALDEADKVQASFACK